MDIAAPVITAHIISNAEVSLTECGRFLAGYGEESNRGGHPMASGSDVALWDDVIPPEGMGTCPACRRAYMAL